MTKKSKVLITKAYTPIAHKICFNLRIYLRLVLKIISLWPQRSFYLIQSSAASHGWHILKKALHQRMDIIGVYEWILFILITTLTSFNFHQMSCATNTTCVKPSNWPFHSSIYNKKMSIWSVPTLSVYMSPIHLASAATMSRHCCHRCCCIYLQLDCGGAFMLISGTPIKAVECNFIAVAACVVLLLVLYRWKDQL